MSDELITKARRAVDVFRDFARQHGMHHFQRDPLVGDIHRALDLADPRLSARSPEGWQPPAGVLVVDVRLGERNHHAEYPDAGEYPRLYDELIGVLANLGNEPARDVHHGSKCYCNDCYSARVVRGEE